MAETKLRTRIFAGLGALLFLVTASALTISVIWQAVTGEDPTATTSQTTTTTTTDTSCAIQSVTGQTALAAPEVYKPEGKTTEVVKTDLEVGTGAEAKSGDCLIMKYYGTLASNGTKFDENYTTDSALEVKIGAGQVITGWDEGVPGMKVGGTRRLVIPAAKGYGDQAVGSIPENADLVFVVKLLEIKK